MEKKERMLFEVWNHLIFPGLIIRSILDIFARVWISFGKILGYTYTKLFGLVGTSWYDHRFDYLRGMDNFHWLERGFFALERIKTRDDVLDLGCGDGIFSGVFYSSKAKRVLAIDIDQKAIAHAQKYYGRKNVRFIKADIKNMQLPSNKFDTIFMFAVLEHFSPEDGIKVLKNIKKSLKKNGIFFGSTPIFSHTKFKANFEHKNEFGSVQELEEFLKTVFKNVRVFQSHWPQRNECYFECM